MEVDNCRGSGCHGSKSILCVMKKYGIRQALSVEKNCICCYTGYNSRNNLMK